MYSEINTLSLTLSISSGIIFGIISGIFAKFPRNNLWFTVILLLNIISPFIGVDTLVIGIRDGGIATGVIVSPFLLSACTIMNLSYIWRYFSNGNKKNDPFNIPY